MSNRQGSPRRPAPRTPRPRPKLRNQVLFVFGILVLAAGAFYTALVVATQVDQIFFPDTQLKPGGLIGKLPGVDKGDDSTDLGGGRINILVMGLDRRPYEGNAATRTDTMFVMDIPTKTGGSFKERINTAYEYGENGNYPGGGSALAKKTVENLLGIKINYYVLIDFQGFKQLIDLIGGIDVDVDSPVNDPYYSDTERLNDFYPCIFDVGVHHMNGTDALCYSRTRRNSSDFDRIQRQQRVIFAAMDRVTQLKLLADHTNVVSLWKRYKDTIQTDISDLQIPGFAKLAAGMQPSDVSFLTLAPATTPYTTADGAAVLLPSEKGIQQIVNGLLSDAKVEQERARVEIQNGTDRQGLAQRAASFLNTNLRIPAESLLASNAATSNHTKTEIVDFTGKRYTAERIAGVLGVPKDRVRSPTAADSALRTDASADIVVILGSDAKVDTSSALAGQ
jgi:LCP family protein required for cell wall assembly